MSKRFRFFIVLGLIILATFFLYPTFMWYVQLDSNKRELSASSNTQLRKYAEKKAYESLKELRELLLKPYSVTTLKNIHKLFIQLKEGKKLLYQYLKENLQDNTKEIIEKYNKEDKITEEMKQTIILDLNKIVESGLFYKPEAFTEVELTKRTLKEAERVYAEKEENPKKDYLILNRTIIEEAFPEEISDIPLPPEYGFLSKNIKEYFNSIKRKTPKVFTVTSAFKSFLKEKDILEVLEDQYREDILKVKGTRRGILELGLDLLGGMKVTIRADFETMARDREGALSDSQKEDAMKRVLEILNNRIDQFGVTEPKIRKQGQDRIIIELPGLADPERIRRVIKGKGRLNFHIIDKEANEKLNEYIKEHPTDYLTPDGELKDKSILPPGTIWREIVEKDEYGIDQRKGLAVIKEEIGLSGNYVADATAQQDPKTFRPIVTFNLSSEGGDLFYKLTSDNEGERMAVVLDDKVKFQAVIQEPIRDRVVVRGQGITYQEASDLALILRTGALPVPLEIIAQEAVGASLGEDAIKIGLNAIILGIILIILFMLFYYRGGGIISDIALIINFFIMAAILSVFNFVLTLPSIAGFILTVGMAVDANVIIFERIKEEYKIGKSRKASVKTGFSKAFLTIVDANITTAIAAIALAYFGRGPIQGFAVILVVGIASSMFTALFVSRLLFDFVTDVFNAKRLSLSWRVSA